MRVDDADDLRFHPHSQLRSKSGQIQPNVNGKILPSAEGIDVGTRIPAKPQHVSDWREPEAERHGCDYCGQVCQKEQFQFN